MKNKIIFSIILITLIFVSIVVTGCKQEINLYFAQEVENNFYLVEESRKIGSNELYRNAIQELIKGPAIEDLFPVLPDTVKVNSVNIENATAIVDFSQEIITDQSIPHSSATERLAIYSIVNTLTQFEKIKEVKITVMGKSSGIIEGKNIEDFWGHIGIAEKFERNPEIIYGEN